MAERTIAPAASNGEVSTAPLQDPDPIPPQADGREEASNQPIHVVRFGAVRACVWPNDDGERTWYQVTVNRLYKDQEGQWRSAESFGYAHLLPLAKALDSAHSWIAERLASSDLPF